MTNKSVFYRMFAFSNSLFVVLMVCLQRKHSSGCPCQNHIATTEVRSIESQDYPNVYTHDTDCRYEISRPSTMTDYYFELQWQHFDVKGRMPFCKEDYVEVFVGNETTSFGRLCSGGLESLHPIYAVAKKLIVRFKTDEVDVGQGFRLSYRLRSIRHPLLAARLNSPPEIRGGIIHTNNWPSSLKETDIKKYFALEEHESIKFTFMDIDFRNSDKDLYSRDCIIPPTDMAITAFNQSSKWISTEKFSLSCNDRAPKMVTLNGGSVIVRIDINKSSKSIRGFVAGYLIYQKEPESSDAAIYDQTVLVSLLTGVGLGIAITVSIYITVSILIKKRIL